MSDNVMEKLSALGELLKIGGTEVGVKMNAGMTSMSFKVKELVQGLNQVDKVVEDATAETLDEPDLATNLELCDMKAFSEVAVEQVLDEMVKLIDDPQTVVNNRNKALTLIEAWGESSDELRYLPVYEETYKSLKSRGIRFPGRDNESLAPIFTPPRSVSASESSPNLAQRLDREIPAQTFSAEQTKEAFDVARNSIELLTSVLSSSPQQYAIEGNEALVFEALNMNDEIQEVISRYEDLKKHSVVHREPDPAMIPVAVEPDDSPHFGKEDALIRKSATSQAAGLAGHNDEMMDNLDEMIFGTKSGGTSELGQDTSKKAQPTKDDLISF
ncbi:hypothetical protein RHSIM_Rhsim07G0247800 [Rhododendron simsii]|uniref:VHS domain-containing protein n=1 Tax=Rhododendron simsii TaxID=118357 RepID=A0A834GTN0_RHOSS|nr:hypothetical protein RHSIM_Rhsim07G0247800 [Rhododendron simsii]